MADLDLVETTFDDPSVDALLERWNTEMGFAPKGGSTVAIDDFVRPAAGPAALFAATGYESISDYNRNPYARYWFAKQVHAHER